MTTDASKLTFLGAPDAVTCEGDACAVPTPEAAETPEAGED
ncbi:hypothetical protein OH146_02150 [Salinibacterium sp. SYSU T00001]|nr:hypothetical protein [Salinibacterium sedimenticola]MCW4384570.1 hypothetical protein [Salinibacterium sedimenticola]